MANKDDGRHRFERSERSSAAASKVRRRRTTDPASDHTANGSDTADPLAEFEPVDTHPDLTTGTGRALTHDLADRLDAIII